MKMVPVVLVMLACCVSISFSQDRPLKFRAAAAFVTVPLDLDPSMPAFILGVKRGYGVEGSGGILL